MWFRILTKEFAEEYGSQIRMDRMLDLPEVTPPMNPDTVYITVVDKDRNVCSFINSIAHAFGSAIVSNKTGILLQNRAGGFRVQPGHPNCIAPGKRPLHTIIPSLVTKAGRAVMPFGVMGGQYQPVGQTHVLTNMLDYGCDVQEAIDMPRGLHYEGVYQLEDGVPAAIVEGLKKLGHKTTSVVGAARRRPGDLDRLGQGHADRRFRSAQGRLRAGLLRILLLLRSAELLRASRTMRYASFPWNFRNPACLRDRFGNPDQRNATQHDGIDSPEEIQCPFFISILMTAVRLEDPVGMDCKSESDARNTADLIARQIAIDVADGDSNRSVVVVDEAGSEIYKTRVRN